MSNDGGSWDYQIRGDVVEITDNGVVVATTDSVAYAATMVATFNRYPSGTHTGVYRVRQFRRETQGSH